MYIPLKESLDKQSVTLVAVSKTKSNEAILNLYNLGQKAFGENRVQELVEKYTALPKDIEWHMIGSLQRNKVKYIAPFVSLIHSVDNLRLIKEINKQAKDNNRVIPILLQLKIAKEESKHGIDPHHLADICQHTLTLSNVQVSGLMGMATFTEDVTQIANEFKMLKESFDICKSKFFHDENSFQHLSMGMSGDYKIAIKEGSTMVRIGSLIFGKRD